MPCDYTHMRYVILESIRFSIRVGGEGKMGSNWLKGCRVSVGAGIELVAQPESI